MLIRDKNKVKNQCFVISDHLRHEFSPGTYLEFKISIGAFDCLNFTSITLPGGSFVANQCTKSMLRINHHLRYEFSHGTYLEFKISIKAFDWLSITSTALLGCSFVATQGSYSWISVGIHEYEPCFAANEHPRRATDVILSQSEAPIELCKF